MKTIGWAAAALALALAAGAGTAADGDKVPYETYDSYFESNRSGLKGPESFLVIGDRKKFDATFGVAAVQRKKPQVLAPDAFDGHLVLAAIHRGNAPWTYKLGSVAAKDGVLTVRYEATAGEAGSATFASPLILSVPKGKYTSAVFVENGKEVAAVPVGK
jgi:hypothetical protein